MTEVKLWNQELGGSRYPSFPPEATSYITQKQRTKKTARSGKAEAGLQVQECSNE